MKDTPANLVTAMQQPLAKVAGCWKIQRKDGMILRFTDHPVDVLVSAETFKASNNYERSASAQSAGFSVDNMEIRGPLFTSGEITEADIIAGRYRNAEVWYFEVDWSDTALGIHKLDYGYIGEITLRGSLFIAEFRSLMQRLDQEIGEKYGRACRVKLGSTKCGVDLDPDVWQPSEAVVVGDVRKASSYDARRYVCTVAGTTNDTEGEPTWNLTIGGTTVETDGVEWETFEAWTKQGAATAVTSRRIFTDTTRSEADNRFRFGELTWTTGDNIGLTQQVKRSLATGLIELKFPMPFDIDIGDGYSIVEGCNHMLKMPGDEWESAYTGDCRAKFNNVANFRGECEIAGQDAALSGQ